MKSPALAQAIGRLTLTKKAADVVIMDLRGLTSMTDFFVVCSADTDIQMRAIADAVEEGLRSKGAIAWHRESGSPNWVLLDYVDVVLHVFHKNTRGFYNLERLWGDAKFTRASDASGKNAPAERPARAKRASRAVTPARKKARA